MEILWGWWTCQMLLGHHRELREDLWWLLNSIMFNFCLLERNLSVPLSLTSSWSFKGKKPDELWLQLQCWHLDLPLEPQQSSLVPESPWPCRDEGNRTGYGYQVQGRARANNDFSIFWNCAFPWFCWVTIEEHPSVSQAAPSPKKAGGNWCQGAENWKCSLGWRKLRFAQGCSEWWGLDEENGGVGVGTKWDWLSAIKGRDFTSIQTAWGGAGDQYQLEIADIHP